MNKGCFWLKRWRKEEKGSFTLEAAFVFPAMFVVVLMFMLFGMYLYQKTIVYYAAAVTSERAVFNWDNSHRDPKSGMLLTLRFDSLYRRLGTESALASMFGFNGRKEAREITISEEAAASAETDNSDLIRSKLIRSSLWLSESSLPYTGKARYLADGFSRYIEVDLRKHRKLLPWEGNSIMEEPGVIAKRYIVDPVEFIRSIDLTRYYSAKLMNHPMGKTTAKSRAKEVLASYGQNNK